MSVISKHWNGAGLDPEEATKCINEFWTIYGSSSLLLAAHAAVLEQIKPELLALIRVNFMPLNERYNTALDADVLFGTLGYYLGGGCYKMDKEVRRHLIIALNVWAVDQGGKTRRSGRVGHFIRHYVRWKLTNQNITIVDADYLNRINWVALAYDEPAVAAESLAHEMITPANAANLTHSRIRFSGIKALIKLPISSYVSVLDYARIMEKCADAKYDEAKSLLHGFGSVCSENIEIGNLTFPNPLQMIDRFESYRSVKEKHRESASNLQEIKHTLSASPKQITSLSDHKFIDEPQINLEDTDLHTAVKANDITKVKKFLSSITKIKSEIIDRLGTDAKTALQLSVERGFKSIVILLCEVEAMIDFRFELYETALMLAASNGHLDICKILLEYNPAIDLKDDSGDRALHLAIQNGHQDIVQLLINKETAIEEPNNNKTTPLCAAAKAGRFLIFETLLINGAKIGAIDKDNFGILAYASAGGNPRILHLLLQLGIQIEFSRNMRTSPLTIAASKGKTAAVEFLISEGANYNEKMNLGYTALHHAAMSGQIETLKQLFEFYPDRNDIFEGAEDGNWTPIKLAALYGFTPIAEYLIDCGDNINVEYKQDWKLIHLASQETINENTDIENDHAGFVRYLLDSGVDVNIKMASGSTPLHIAAIHNAITVAEILISHPDIDINMPDNTGQSVLLIAASKGNDDIIRKLLDDPRLHLKAETKKGERALYLAVIAKSTETVTTLLTHPDIDRNHVGKENLIRPICKAIDLELWDIFSLLCDDLHVDILPNKKSDGSLLHQAVSANQINAVISLLKRETEINLLNSDKETPLILAIRSSNQTIIQLLLAAGAHLKLVEGTDLSPLEEAVKSDKMASIKLLINKGASLHNKNYQGRSLIHVAAMYGHNDVLNLLVELGIGVNELDIRQRTPLHIAAKYGQTDVFDLLIKQGADWKCRDVEGSTPLHLAIRHGQINASINIINHGIDVKQSNIDGWTALHFAALHNMDTLVNELFNIGARPNDIAYQPPVTPLQVAAEIGAEKACMQLIKIGVDLNYANSRKASAVFLAITNGHFKLAIHLIEAGASTNTFDIESASILHIFNLRKQRRLQTKTPTDEFEDKLFSLLSSQIDLELDTLNISEIKNVETEIQNNVSLSTISALKGLAFNEPEKELLDKPEFKKVQTKVGGLNIQNSEPQSTFYPMQSLSFDDPKEQVSWPWVVITGSRHDSIIKRLNPIDGKFRINKASTQIVETTLPFYESVVLLRVRDRNWNNPRLAIFYLLDVKTNNYFRLNGTSPPIHEVNAKHPITLNENSVLDYVRFFGFFVRGEEGPFYVIESKNDPCLATSLSGVALTVLAGAVRPLTFEGYNKEGEFMVSSCIAYSNALFIAHYTVQKTGMVNMNDDDPIAADLPILINAPIS